MLQQTVRTCGLALAIAAAAVLPSHAQSETYTATASVKTAGGAAATAPVTIVVDRKMPQSEADKFLAAFKSGGTAALRKALAGVAPTGSVRVGGGSPTPTRLTIERPTDKGRLLTIVTDTPILHLGAGVSRREAQGRLRLRDHRSGGRFGGDRMRARSRPRRRSRSSKVCSSSRTTAAKS